MHREYIDIHNVGNLNPKDYDILLINVDYNILKAKISKFGGILYF